MNKLMEYYTEKYYEGLEKDSRNAKRIGHALGSLTNLKVDIEYDNVDILEKKINDIYNIINEIEL